MRALSIKAPKKARPAEEKEAPAEADADAAEAVEDTRDEEAVRAGFFDEVRVAAGPAGEALFSQLHLSRPLLRAVEALGFVEPTAVQARLLGSGLLVDRTVALVDAHAFPALFAATAPLRERLELLEAGEVECEVDEQVAALVQSGLYPV